MTKQKKDPAKTDAQDAQKAQGDNVTITERTVEEELASCKEQLAAETERRLRALAEAENLKKRLIKEKEDFAKYAAERVLADFLPVVDTLEMALAHAADNPACKDLVVGVDMTRKLFVDVLVRNGVTPVGQPGEAFDPAVHEAVGMASDPSLDDDAVAAVLGRGYTLNGRLLRPARVTVNKRG